MSDNGLKNDAQAINETENQKNTAPDETNEEQMADFAAQAEELLGRLQRVDELEREVNEWKSKYARLFADFENYRRRTAEDVLDSKSKGEAAAIEAILPIYDNLSRAIEIGANEPQSLLPGLKSVRENFWKALSDLGLEEVEGKGAQFDPFVHEALSAVDGEEDGRVMDVYQHGFKLRGKLLRPARVVVSKKSS